MQKYRVFINRHLIFLSDDQNLLENIDNAKLIIEPEENQIIALVNDLLNEEKEVETHHLYYPSIENAWKRFKACFQVIQAAGGIVFNNSGELLVIHRLGYWDLPKGKLEIGESIEEAAVREVEEECGISGLEIISKLPSTYHVYMYKIKLVLKQTHWFKMNYNGNEGLVPQTEEAIDEVTWATKKELDKILANTYESLKPLFQTYLS